MNISIITLTFPPEPAQHILDLAAGLVRRGHSVTVLTSLPSYPYGRVYDAFRNRLLSISWMQGARVVRLPVLPSHARSFMRRGAYYLSNALSILAYNLLTILSRSDITIVYHPPLTTALPALFMKAVTATRFVHWIHDMWPETLEEGGVRNRRLLNLIAKTAHYVYRNAAHVIVLSEGFKRNLIAKGIPAERVSVIPNWAHIEEHPLIRGNDDGRTELRLPADYFYVLYAGNLGEMQALESVILALKLLDEGNDIVLLFLGSGTREEELKQFAIRCGMSDRVKFLGRVSPSEVGTYYSLADALLVHIRNSSLFRITIPHKIYEYMLAAKPIIAGISGDARDEVLSAGAGIACEPETPMSIAEAMMRIRALSPEQRAAMGERGRQYVHASRSPDSLIDRMEAILMQAATRNAGMSCGGK